MNSQISTMRKQRDQSINSHGKRPGSVSSAGAGGKGSGRSFADTSTTVGISLIDIWNYEY